MDDVIGLTTIEIELLPSSPLPLVCTKVDNEIIACVLPEQLCQSVDVVDMEQEISQQII